jgi:AcrR family transcriptional regulator
VDEHLSNDPRVTRTRAAVRVALVAILEEEGAGALTHQRVAERAGVSRATVYRHWPTAADLVIEALSQANEPLLHPGEGPFRTWLVGQLTAAAAELRQAVSTQTLVTLVGAAQHDPDVAELRDRILAATQAPLARAIGRAVEAGELAGAPDPSELLSMVLGPLVFRVIVQCQEADADYVQQIVDGSIAGWTR